MTHYITDNMQVWCVRYILQKECITDMERSCKCLMKHCIKKKSQIAGLFFSFETRKQTLHVNNLAVVHNLYCEDRKLFQLCGFPAHKCG